MKRKLLGLVILALLLFVPLMVHAATAGKFTSVEGNVDVTSPGKEARPANIGDPLNVGDIIRTKSKAKCEVAFPDGSILRLAENSRLRVNDFVQEKGERNATLDLFRGKIQNVVMAVTGAASGQSKYEIHTPTAVVGVRGTILFVYHQAGVTGAAFKEGTGYGYSLNRPGDIRTIHAGQAMTVSNPNVPPVVRPATVLEMNQHRKDTAPAEKPKSEAKKEEEKRSESVAAKTGEAKSAGKTAAAASSSEQSRPVDMIARTMEAPSSAALSLLPAATASSQTILSAPSAIPTTTTTLTSGSSGTGAVIVVPPSGSSPKTNANITVKFP